MLAKNSLMLPIAKLPRLAIRKLFLTAVKRKMGLPLSTETVSTYQLVKKQVLPTIVSPWALAFVDFPTERALVPSYDTTTLLLVRNIPILFQQFLC